MKCKKGMPPMIRVRHNRHRPREDGLSRKLNIGKNNHPAAQPYSASHGWFFIGNRSVCRSDQHIGHTYRMRG